MLNVRTHGLGQSNPLEVTTLESDGFQTVSIGQIVGALGNDGAVIKGTGDVVGGRANHFDAAFHRLSVRIGSREGGKKSDAH